uniref:glycosyltransferase n=1 Tax=Fluviicola sp. TaxID=1917219 RepID=UPI004049BA9E
MVKNALIISYYWPPSGGSGVQRWMYFAKYLKANGIEPIVLTIDPKSAAYPAYDPSLLKHTEGIQVVHSAGGFQLLKLYSLIKSGSTKGHIPVGDFGSKKKTLIDKIAGSIRANLFVPDARVGWNKKALPVAAKIIASENIDFVITTGPPHSTHLIGLALKQQFNIHWVSDFRDPWREVYYNKLFKRFGFADKKDARLEKAVLTHSDTVLTVGPTMKKLLATKTDESKIFYIHNGFDVASFTGLTTTRYVEKTICHIGVWTSNQPYQIICTAIQQLLVETSLKLRFVVVGSVAEEITDALQAIPNLIVDIHGKVSHQVALQEMKNADVLLNCLPIQDNAELLVSGKLMEYLASGNQVLVLGKTKGDAAAIINEVHSSAIVENDDYEGVYTQLKTMLSSDFNNENIPSAINKYSREATAAQLASLLLERLK